jgi:hypothetical protein
VRTSDDPINRYSHQQLDSEAQAMSLKKYTISGFNMTPDQANSVEEVAKFGKCESGRNYE